MTLSPRWEPAVSSTASISSPVIREQSVLSYSLCLRIGDNGTRKEMDKLASLRAFVKVVETGSFAEAGRQLRLSRSAISKYVAELEESLGIQLLNRTTRHVSPNENGQIYFERAFTVLTELDAADHAVAQAQST